MIPRWLILFVLTAALMLVAMPVAASNASITTYLRPNADRPSELPWTPVGASSAWGALDDGVIETETPSNSDYIAATVPDHSSITYTSTVDLTTLSLAGQTILSGTAWFYSPTKTSITLTIEEQGDHILTSKSFTGIGWHSLSAPLSGNQAQVDNLDLGFKASGAGTRQVSAAFLKLSIEPPAHSIYWGSWMDGDVYSKEGEAPWGDAPWDQNTWNSFEKHAGRAPSLVHFGQPAPWKQSFAEEPLALTAKRGAIPLMDMSSEGATLSEIASGARDSTLKEWAAAAKKYGKPFLFRWNWEMNGTWFIWGKEAATNPSTYVEAWRHFHSVVEEQGATNITWVWCPNVNFEGSTSLSSLYPGDAYVDWTCMDGYNRGEALGGKGHPWTSFSTLFQPTYTALLSLAPSKPIIVGETASTESGGSKSQWIEDMLGVRLPITFPSIKAFAWFNWNIFGEELGAKWDWPIESSASAETAFAHIISSPYYAANTFESLPSLTRIQPLP